MKQSLKESRKCSTMTVDYMCNKFKFKNVSFSNALKQLLNIVYARIEIEYICFNVACIEETRFPSF